MPCIAVGRAYKKRRDNDEKDYWHTYDNTYFGTGRRSFSELVLGVE
jgi:hypothetical protein